MEFTRISTLKTETECKSQMMRVDTTSNLLLLGLRLALQVTPQRMEVAHTHMLRVSTMMEEKGQSTLTVRARVMLRLMGTPQSRMLAQLQRVRVQWALPPYPPVAKLMQAASPLMELWLLELWLEFM